MRLRFEAVESSDAAYRCLIDWLASLPEDLSRRAVLLLPNERVSHAVRRRVCIDEQRPGLLAGVLLLKPTDLAREILARSGVSAPAGGEDVRRLRVLGLLRSGTLPLGYFRIEQLRSGRGYTDAFVRAIADLENSGLTATAARTVADDLAAEDPLAANRLRDVAAVWTAVESQGCRRYTTGRLLQEAASALREHPDLLRSFGPVAAMIAMEPEGSLLRFVESIPECRVVLIDALPVRTGTQRWRSDREPLTASSSGRPAPASPTQDLGPLFAELVRSEPERAKDSGVASEQAVPTNELGLLQRFLFAPPEALAQEHRPRSAGPDGTVDLEEYPSIEEEIEATAVWVAEQVSRGVPAEEIAVIVPEVDPYARLLLDRLSRVGRADGSSGDKAATVGVYVAGGLSLADTPAGVRLLSLLRAWRHALNAESTIRVLPALKRVDEESPRLSASLAAELVYGAGIVGGSPGDPRGAHEWVPRLEGRRQSLERIIGDAQEAPVDEPEKQRHQWDRDKAAKDLATLRSLIPAVSALQAVAEKASEGAPLSLLWPAVREFVENWYRLLPDPPNLTALLEERLEGVLDDPSAERVQGFSALDWMIDTLRHARFPLGRFGEPRVFVGTATGAAALPFQCVRVVGLAEGALPSTPHDDPIVPNDLRRAIEKKARRLSPDIVLPRIEDRVLEDLHGFYRVVTSTSGRLALSGPRQWVDRSEREVSGVMLEIAAALGRPPVTVDAEQEPSAARLRADYFSPGRGARQLFAADQLPLASSAIPQLVQRRGDVCLVPMGWCGHPATALDRMHALAAARDSKSLGETDGVLGDVGKSVAMPGLTAEHPISASALTTLWRCPHWFFVERVLGLRPPTQRPSTDTIDPLSYGSLFHAAAESFYREAGAAVCQRVGSLPEWIERARAIASAQFDALCDEYPLRGADAIERERERLLRQIEQLVRYEWDLAPRTFVATELSFGRDESVRLDLPGGPVFVRGTIDRVDRVGSQLSVRDLKTGRVHDFGEEPIGPVRDLQIGLYSLVLETNASLNGRVVHAAYVHPSESMEAERGFRDAALRALRDRTKTWLAGARGLLEGGQFPRTPNADDCRFCPYLAACGDGAQLRSAGKLNQTALPPPVDIWRREKSSATQEE